MGIDVIFFIAFLLCFIGLIFFIIRKPKVMARWQIILIFLAGMFVYGILFGIVCYDESKTNETSIVKIENNRIC